MKPRYRYFAATMVGVSVGYLAYRSAPIAIGAFAAAAALNQFDLLAKVTDLKKAVEELKNSPAAGPKP